MYPHSLWRVFWCAVLSSLLSAAWCADARPGMDVTWIKPLSDESRSQPGAIGAAAQWERFTSHLRTGRMREAYACFDKRSQAVFSYDDFCTHYSPLTAASEATLSPIDEGDLQLMGDVARLRFLGASRSPLSDTPHDDLADLVGDLDNGPAAGVYVTALLTREGGGWKLVAAAREAEARAEAEARNLLRELWRTRAVRQSRETGATLNTRHLIQAAPRVFRQVEAQLCLQSYAFFVEHEGPETRLLARPNRRGLRVFGIRTEAEPVPSRGGIVATAHDPVAGPELDGLSIPERPGTGMPLGAPPLAPDEFDDTDTGALAPPPPPPPDSPDPETLGTTTGTQEMPPPPDTPDPEEFTSTMVPPKPVLTPPENEQPIAPELPDPEPSPAVPGDDLLEQAIREDDGAPPPSNASAGTLSTVSRASAATAGEARRIDAVPSLPPLPDLSRPDPVRVFADPPTAVEEGVTEDGIPVVPGIIDEAEL